MQSENANRRLWKLALPLVLSGIAQANQSAAGDDILSLADLMNLKVTTSTQTAVEITKAPATIYSYSGEELRRWGIRSIGDIINYLVPGATLTEDGDETIAAFRGVSTDNSCKVLALINGHAVNPQWAKGATPELELALMADVDHIEVIVGPGSALYGSGATIGVINLITRTAAQQNSGSVTTSMGSDHSGSFDASFAARLNENASVSMSAGMLKADGFERRDGSATENAPLYISGHPLNSRFFTQFNYQNTEFQGRYASVTRNLYNSVTTPKQQKTGPALYELWNSYFAELKQTIRPTSTLKAELSGTIDANETKRFDHLRGWVTRAVGEERYGLSSRVFWTPSPEFDLVSGVEYHYDKFGPDFEGLNFQTGPSLDTATGLVKGLNIDYSKRMLTPYERSEVGAYSQANYNFSERISLLGGFRLDYIEAPGMDEEKAFTPRIGLVVTPAPSVTLKALFSSGFRQPMAILTSPDGYMLGSAKAKSNITSPERVQSGELTGSWLATRSLSLSLNTFYNRFDDLHSLRSNSDGSLEFLSGGTVDYFGGEAIAWLRMPEQINLRLSHQLAKPGISRDDPNHVLLSPDGENLMFYPENVTKGLVEIPLLSFLSANMNGSYVWNSYGYQGTYGATSDLRESDGYFLLNANLVLSHKAWGDLTLSGYNLLDENPEVPFTGTIGAPVSMTRVAGLHWSVAYSHNL